MLSAASQFLDELERTMMSEQDLPNPHVMRRILHLLAAVCPIELPSAAAQTSTTQTTTGGEADSYARDRIREFRKCVRALKATTCPLFVDVQCLNSTRGFVIKEFSAECLGSPSAWITVKSPSDDVPRQIANEYTSTQINGLHWDCGLIDLQQLKDFTAELFENTERNVFVKGSRKVDVLVEQLGIPRESIKELWFCPQIRLMREQHVNTNSCPYHRNLDRHLACAEKNTHALVKSGITDFLLERWFDSMLRRCDSCHKTARCVEPRRDLDGYFFDICCKCKTIHQYYWRCRNNPHVQCHHLQRELNELSK